MTLPDLHWGPTEWFWQIRCGGSLCPIWKGRSFVDSEMGKVASSMTREGYWWRLCCVYDQSDLLIQFRKAASGSLILNPLTPIHNHANHNHIRRSFFAISFNPSFSSTPQQSATSIQAGTNKSNHRCFYSHRCAPSSLLRFAPTTGSCAAWYCCTPSSWPVVPPRFVSCCCCSSGQVLVSSYVMKTMSLNTASCNQSDQIAVLKP